MSYRDTQAAKARELIEQQGISHVPGNWHLYEIPKNAHLTLLKGERRQETGYTIVGYRCSCEAGKHHLRCYHVVAALAMAQTEGHHLDLQALMSNV